MTAYAKNNLATLSLPSMYLGLKMFSKGEVVRINLGYFYHYGIADGYGNVVHNSKKHGKVVCELMDDFSEGRSISSCPFYGNENGKALEIAKRNIGKKYSLFNYNCEHFVSHCFGLKPESRQLENYALSSIALLTFIKSSPQASMASAVAGVSSLAFSSKHSQVKNIALSVLATVALVSLIQNISN